MLSTPGMTCSVLTGHCMVKTWTPTPGQHSCILLIGETTINHLQLVITWTDRAESYYAQSQFMCVNQVSSDPWQNLQVLQNHA